MMGITIRPRMDLAQSRGRLRMLAAQLSTRCRVSSRADHLIVRYRFIALCNPNGGELFDD
jgi:hypothetical protein